MPVVNCVCGFRHDGPDDEALFRDIRAHSDAAHADLAITDGQIHELLAARARMTEWDGRPIALATPPEIRPLTAERGGEFLKFFDRDAFMDSPFWASCHCMFPHLPPDDPEWESRTWKRNRTDKEALILGGQAQGYLAYAGDRVIGWCHAAPRVSLPQFDRRKDFGVDDRDRVGSIVCFVVAAPYRRQGIARRLLDAACDSLRAQGLTIAEAYPGREATSAAHAFTGTIEMYEAAGFERYRKTERAVMMRKQL